MKQIFTLLLFILFFTVIPIALIIAIYIAINYGIEGLQISINSLTGILGKLVLLVVTMFITIFIVNKFFAYKELEKNKKESQ